MTARTWHSGPPPHVGWWNASPFRSSRIWRWWDGGWSRGVDEDATDEEASVLAKLRTSCVHQIEWSDYYPENARVPRVDPRQADYAIEPQIVASSVDTASGLALDAIGGMKGFFREWMEPDVTFRARIQNGLGLPLTPAPKAKRRWFARLVEWVKS